jgi:predicted ATPase
MLIKHIKVSGLLSFGAQGIDLSMNNLTVLIGPNGSGKSNLLEVLALLKAAPRNLPEPVKEMGGVREWLWKDKSAPKEATLDVVIANLDPKRSEKMDLRHVLSIRDHGGRFEVADERIENRKRHAGKSQVFFHYRFQRGSPVLQDFGNKKRMLKRQEVRPEESILSQVKDPGRYPVLAYLQKEYEDIKLFRNWSFGPSASLRVEQSTHSRNDFLNDGGDNLPLVLSNILSRVRPELLEALGKLYEGITDLSFQISGGNLLLFLVESGGREIPATRLSDGTLRYLCLLAILLHPDPPALIAIDEPELGLHPDVIPTVAELLVRASERTQLVVTTHSRMLVDALGDDPSRVVVCEQRDRESHFERLGKVALSKWLKDYSLGDLWSIGQLGGNRW